MQTRGQVIDRQIAHYEGLVSDLMRYYEEDLPELLRGTPDNHNMAAEIQMGCLLTMSHAARAIIAMKDYKLAYDKEVIDNLHHLLKKADPTFKPLEEIYAEQEAKESKDDDDNDDLDSE